jgi:hypothetical protein
MWGKQNYMGMQTQGMNQNMNNFNMFNGLNGMYNQNFNNALSGIGAGTGALQNVSNGILNYGQSAMNLYPSYINAATYNPFAPTSGLSQLGGAAGNMFNSILNQRRP